MHLPVLYPAAAPNSSVTHYDDMAMMPSTVLHRFATTVDALREAMPRFVEVVDEVEQYLRSVDQPAGVSISLHSSHTEEELQRVAAASFSDETRWARFLTAAPSGTQDPKATFVEVRSHSGVTPASDDINVRLRLVLRHIYFRLWPAAVAQGGVRLICCQPVAAEDIPHVASGLACWLRATSVTTVLVPERRKGVDASTMLAMAADSALGTAVALWAAPKLARRVIPPLLQAFSSLNVTYVRPGDGCYDDDTAVIADWCTGGVLSQSLLAQISATVTPLLPHHTVASGRMGPLPLLCRPRDVAPGAIRAPQHRCAGRSNTEHAEVALVVDAAYLVEATRDAKHSDLVLLATRVSEDVQRLWPRTAHRAIALSCSQGVVDSLTSLGWDCLMGEVESADDHRGIIAAPGIQQRDVDPFVISAVIRAVQCPRVSEILLLAGDGDFAPVVRFAMDSGKCVTVLCSLPLRGDLEKVQPCHVTDLARPRPRC